MAGVLGKACSVKITTVWWGFYFIAFTFANETLYMFSLEVSKWENINKNVKTTDKLQTLIKN